MFNDLTDKQKSPEIDDIFAETDKVSSSSDLSAIETRQVGLSSVNNSVNTQKEEESLVSEDDESNSSSGKVLKIAIFVVVVAILVLGSYLVYTNFIKKDKVADLSNNENNQLVNEEKVDQDLQSNQITNNNNEDDFIVPVSERQNLEPLVEEKNNQEPALETDLRNMDSDGDGLSDYDEIYIYKTNPNLVDTDGDGYSDYEEVTNGYNPLGEGLLPGFSR